MKEVYLKIFGRVQGVGFRRYVEKKAYAIGGVSGWVRNTDDRCVEVLMRGDEAKIEEMIKACYKGALMSRVDRIEFKPQVTNWFLPEIVDGVFERI